MNNVTIPRIAVFSLMLVGAPVLAQQFAYVPRASVDLVDVIDSADNSVVASIPVGDEPWGVAVHPQGHRAYVSNVSGDSVSVIDTASNLVVATISVGDQPQQLAISPDGSEVWVGNRADGSVSVIATGSDTVVDTITGIAAAGAIGFEPAGRYAWVGSLNSVVRVSTENHAQTNTVGMVGTTEGIAVNPDGTAVYVTRQTGASTVAVIDTDTLAISDSASIGLGQWGVAVHPNGRFYYVAAANRVRVLRASDDVAAAIIALPDGNGATAVSVSPNGHFLYVTNRTSGNLHVISTVTNAIVDTVVLGNAPTGLGNFFAQPMFGQGGLAAGADHACRLSSYFSADCWGHSGDGTLTAPEERFRGIVAGNRYSCGILGDSSREILCWGEDNFGVLAAPSGKYMLVGAGAEHACGIRAAGYVGCWGRNDQGQATAPAATNKFADIAGGGTHSCGVRTDGAILCWGNDAAGQSTPIAAMPGQHYVQVITGTDFTCGLQTDGLANCWGNAADGRTTPAGGRFAALSADANADYACGRRFDGSIECWGADSSGETTPPAGAFALHSAGANFGCALGTLGELECWGDNAVNQAPQFFMTPASLPDAAVGVAYEQGPLSMEIVDPGSQQYKTSFAFGQVDGDLPPGLVLDGNTISGTPTTAGAYTFTVRGEDMNGFNAERTFTITVN